MLKDTYERMSTEVLIPVTPAPADPEWLYKKKAGERLNAEEIRSYHIWKHDENHKKLEKVLYAPTGSELTKIFDINYRKKLDCVFSHSCAGWNYAVYDGLFD